MKKMLNILFTVLAVSCIKSGRSDVPGSILGIDAGMPFDSAEVSTEWID